MQPLRGRLLPQSELRALLMLLALAALPSAPDRASASEGDGARPAFVSIMGGWRIFNSQLGLKDDVSAGLRLGLGVAPRVVLMTDFTVSGANRSVGTGTATVHALRALARFDIFGGSTRPYVVTGAGGVLFDFSDAQDYATGTSCRRISPRRPSPRRRPRTSTSRA